MADQIIKELGAAFRVKKNFFFELCLAFLTAKNVLYSSVGNS